jgi:hypothetical protein
MVIMNIENIKRRKQIKFTDHEGRKVPNLYSDTREDIVKVQEVIEGEHIL